MKYLFSLMVLLTSNSVMAHGISTADNARYVEAGFWEYIQLGAGHMLTGYDHLLFLFGVIFFLKSFKDIIKFITAFTIGHSITLMYATYSEIQVNYYLIDAVIALTVCYKAFENLDGFRRLLNSRAPNLLVMVFIFGLIHGLGLSTRLQQLPLGHGEDLAMKIIGFNIGVELGQIIALSVIMLLLSGWRNRGSFVWFSRLANVAIMLAGMVLFAYQVQGYRHQLQHERLDRERALQSQLVTPAMTSQASEIVQNQVLIARTDIES